jgi:hypothetical protein
MEPASTESIKRFGIGLSMILAPLLLGVGFAIHPPVGFAIHPPQTTSGAQELRMIVATSGRWDLAHVLILISLVLFIPALLGVMRFLQRRGAWLGLIGGVFVAIGVVFFAAWVGAEGFASSTLAGLPSDQQAALAPAMHAIIDAKGALTIVDTTSVLLIGGLLVLAIGLFVARTVGRWMSVAMVVGVLVLIVGASFGVKIILVGGCVLLVVGMGGMGVQLLQARTSLARRGVI